MTPDNAVPWVAIIAIGAPALAAFGGLLLFFVKRFLRKSEEVYDLRFAQLHEKIATLDSGLDRRVVELGKRVDDLFAAHDRLRDRWDEFLREYLKIDATRGQKIDALFRVVDDMQNALKEIRPAMNSKIEDAFSRALSELKVYVRDQIREERK